MFASPGLMRLGWSRITPHFVCKHNKWEERHCPRKFGAVFIADMSSIRGERQLLHTPKKEYFTDKMPTEVVDVSRGIYSAFEMMVNENDQFDLLVPHCQALSIHPGVYSESGNEEGFRLSALFEESNGKKTTDRFILPTAVRPLEFSIGYAVNRIFRSPEEIESTPKEKRRERLQNIVSVRFPESGERILCMSLNSEVPVSLWSSKSSLEIEGCGHSIKRIQPLGYVCNSRNEVVPVYQRVQLTDFGRRLL